MGKKINAYTQITLLKKGIFVKYNEVMCDYFSSIVKYLLNNNLIIIPDEYLIPMEDENHSWIKRDYPRIFKDFKKIANKDYKIEIYVPEPDDGFMSEADYQTWGRL